LALSYSYLIVRPYSNHNKRFRTLPDHHSNVVAIRMGLIESAPGCFAWSVNLWVIQYRLDLCDRNMSLSSALVGMVAQFHLHRQSC
jgi:hypothetical protein